MQEMWSGGGKIYKINKRGGGIYFLWRVECFKIGKYDFTFIREMRVGEFLGIVQFTS